MLWGADLLARKEKLAQLTDPRQLLMPLLPGTAIFCLLVMAGKDLGTTFLFIVIFLALLWVIGAPGKVLAGMVGLMALVLLMLIVVEPYRLGRLLGFLSAQSTSQATAAATRRSRARTHSGRAGFSAWALARAG